MMEYFYRIYGLRVQSQIPFSEAVPETAGEAEVKIVFGRMPDFLLEAGQKGYGTWTNGFVSACRGGNPFFTEVHCIPGNRPFYSVGRAGPGSLRWPWNCCKESLDFWRMTQ